MSPPTALRQLPAVSQLPPTIDGVGPSCVGLPAGSWPTVLDFLAQRFPAQARVEWLRRMRAGRVLDETGHPIDEQRSYKAHTRVYYYRHCPVEPASAIDAPLLYRDAHLLVVDKPHGLPVVPSGGYLQHTLLVHLKRQLGIDTLVPIHRIDRDTAGLVMFSLLPETRDAYHALFRVRQVHKTYEAVAPWHDGLSLPLTRRSRIAAGAHFLQQQEQPGEPNAETRLESVRRMGAMAVYRLHPVTGHRHQLRVHMAALGLPIVGDGIYPDLLPAGSCDPSLPLQLLARSIRFTDPVDGRERRFTSQRHLAMVSHDAVSDDVPGR